MLQKKGVTKNFLFLIKIFFSKVNVVEWWGSISL